MPRQKQLAQLSKSDDSSPILDHKREILFGSDNPHAQVAHWLNKIGNDIREYSGPDGMVCEGYEVDQLAGLMLSHIRATLERLSQLANDADSAELAKDAMGLLVLAQSELTMIWNVVKKARSLPPDARAKSLGYVCKQLARICCPRLAQIGARFAAISRYPEISGQDVRSQSAPSEENDEAMPLEQARALFDEKTLRHYQQSASILSKAMTGGKLKFVKKNGKRWPLLSSLLLFIEDRNRRYAKKSDTEYDPYQLDE